MENLKILVIDDEFGIRESVKRALRKFTVSLPYIEEDYGFDIDSAETAEEGIEMMRANNYSILLLDNQLPGMNGTELLEKLHEEDSNIITIMITAYASIETAITATKNGAYDFLTKPFKPEELKNAVHKAGKHYILNSVTKKLTEEKNKIRFQFISVLSHELKSPIAAISNYLKLMEKRIGGNDIESYDEYIERSQIRIKDMEKLIFDLLDLTRIESGEKKRDLEEVNVSEIVEEAVSNIEDMVLVKELKVDMDIENAIINADKTEIEIIVNNLISNAIKYNIDSGKIEIKLLKSNGALNFSVSDTGIGIEKDDINKLFKEFSRIKNEKTLHISGSGIGLSTVKKIVGLYDGDIKVESEYGKGTKFTVELNKI
ncbi:MAG: ATP-binding protein [Candidatus Delongbacteria bacterium]|jgi:two-component system sensor histidine kinase/response regulator|nr:ATP-binding protein [Candidatus Delongbacteria bacterium]